MPTVCDMSEYLVGSHVKIRGTIKYNVHPYLWVINKYDVSLASTDKKRMPFLLKGKYLLKRISGH